MAFGESMSDKIAATREKKIKLERRKKRVHKRLFGTPARPRLAVFRSNANIFAQIIDDVTHRTITGCSSITPAIKEKISSAKGKIAKAKIVGEHVAELAKSKGITQVMFDRNGQKYHGRVKALAEGARAGGLEV